MASVVLVAEAAVAAEPAEDGSFFSGELIIGKCDNVVICKLDNMTMIRKLNLFCHVESPIAKNIIIINSVKLKIENL